MSASDYFIDLLLIGIVALQMRPRPQTTGTWLRPLVLVLLAAGHYIHAVPFGGSDWMLLALLPCIGVALGSASALATRVWCAPDGRAMTQAGLVAAGFWVAGMGARFVFAVWATTDRGGVDLARFSIRHDVTSAQVWVTALVLMAVGEVVGRIALLSWRSRRLASARC